LSHLRFRTFYSRQYFHALFFANIFKHKIDYSSIMDTAGLRVSTKQTMDFPLLMGVTIQDSAHHRGIQQLQAASADFRSFQ
jgi:hypothetical protein